MQPRLYALNPDMLDVKEYVKEGDEVYMMGMDMGMVNMTFPAPATEANLITSAVDPSAKYHQPTLDIDLPCRLVPSQTEGHFHLYIDLPNPLTWPEYAELLGALADAGIIQEGFADASLYRQFSALRKHTAE